MKYLRIFILRWLRRQYVKRINPREFDSQLSQVLDCLEYILDYEREHK